MVFKSIAEEISLQKHSPLSECPQKLVKTDTGRGEAGKLSV